MSHDPESRTRHEFAAREDLITPPETPQPGGPSAADGSIGPGGLVDGSQQQSHDPYQPL